MTEINMKKRLLGKVAVVTGAGRGMGRAHALLLAQQGAKVVVNDLGCDVYGKGADASIAQKVVDEIKREGGEAIANSDTVATWEGAGRIINTALDAFGHLDILINNAGILRFGAIHKLDEADLDALINTHLKGHFATIRYAAPIFRQQRSGVIINTSSEAGLGGTHQACYSAAKEGIVGLTRTIARELGRFNVRCNAIRPFAKTRMSSLPEIFKALKSTEKELGIPALGNRPVPILSGDISKPEQVAVMVVWLCTDAAAHINGRIFQVGNGEIGLYSEPDVIRSVFELKAWDLDMLDSSQTSTYLTGDLSNMFLPPQASK